MSDKYPWDNWVPGALSFAQTQKLIKEGYIDCKDEIRCECDHSSMDITLSDEVYHLPEGSVKPFGGRYLHKIKSMGLAEKAANNNGSFLLDRKHTYIVKLNENIASLRDSCIFGQATAKSTIGRMDVLARLIVDGMDTYEEFRPECIGNGAMYLEITPMTFFVEIKPDTALTQLRLFKGAPSECEISSPTFFSTVIQNDPSNKDGSLSLDTTPVQVTDKMSASAFRSKGESEDYIPLWRLSEKDKIPPEKYWEPIKSNKHDRLTIRPSQFYIMRSFEKIAVPKGVAVYCRATDETIGEMRIHYAGFAHPYFGYKQEDEEPVPIGTPLVFEVRGHDVNVSLNHREKMARLVFYRMSEDANTDDKSIDDADPYQHQSLQLSKFFKEWEQ